MASDTSMPPTSPHHSTASWTSSACLRQFSLDFILAILDQCSAPPINITTHTTQETLPRLIQPHREINYTTLRHTRQGIHPNHKLVSTFVATTSPGAASPRPQCINYTKPPVAIIKTRIKYPNEKHAFSPDALLALVLKRSRCFVRVWTRVETCTTPMFPLPASRGDASAGSFDTGNKTVERELRGTPYFSFNVAVQVGFPRPLKEYHRPSPP